MKEVFRDPDSIRIGMCQSILEEAGIPTFLENKSLSGLAVQIPEFFPALCVLHDEDYDRAAAILRERFQSEDAERPALPDVTCPQCGAQNPANFDLCWSCQSGIV